MKVSQDFYEQSLIHLLVFLNFFRRAGEDSNYFILPDRDINGCSEGPERIQATLSRQDEGFLCGGL